MNPPARGNARGFQTEHLVREPRSAVTKRRLTAALARHGLQRRGSKIEEHERSGRNRLFLIELDDGSQWLAKHCLTFTFSEAWFYSEAARHLDSVPRCLLSDVADDLVVVEYLSDAQPVDRLVREDFSSVLALLPDLARVLARTHCIVGSLSDVPMARTPLPELDPIDVDLWINASPGAQQLVAGLHKNPKLSGALRRAFEGGGTPGLVHGDLKLDNILTRAGTPYLIDWECCGRGSIEWDVGAVIGSLIMSWSDRSLWNTQPEMAAEGDIGSASLGNILKACAGFVETYTDQSLREGGSGVDRKHLAIRVVAWIVGRSWVESTFSRRPLRSHGLRLVIAEDLIDHPDQLFRT